MPESPPNWETVKALIADALERPAEERGTFLVSACGDDAGLLDEVRALIDSYEAAEGVIDRRTDAWLGLGGPDLLALGGQRIGRYQLERLIAEGAMAAVYAARQVNPRRQVALKLLRAGLPLIDSAERFRREAAALGRLEHPNVARIYEAGVHARDGVHLPYIAMELVDGPPLTVYARDKRLSREERLGLMIKVALAVHAAHQRAVIHRDLKPANVLVDASSGEPKVLDFGIARIAGVEDEARTWQTTAGVLLGTPGYMSPEQAGGRLEEVDVRSDVWALGILLHELLTDRLPVDVRNTSIAEALRRIETTDPPPIGRLDPALRGDLETVVSTALARDKERRYPSAQALADDLRRVLDYQPISARPPSGWYRARKFVRRHRVGLAFSAAVALLLVAASVVSSVAFLRAERERRRAEGVNVFLQEVMSITDPTIGSRDITVLEALAQSERLIQKNFAEDPVSEADVRYTIGWIFYNLSRYEQAVEHLRRAVALRTGQFGPSDERTIDATSRLVTAMRWQYGDPAEVLKLVEPAYHAAVGRLGEAHPSTLSLLDAYAGTLGDLGRAADAERMYRRAVELNRRVLGLDANQTLTAMNNLAVVLLGEARWSDAETVLREVIAIRERGGKAARTLALTNRHNLGSVLVSQGRLDDALGVLESAIADATVLLGEDHSRTLSARVTYADALVRAGRAEEGLSVHRDVLARRLPLGPAHEQVLVSTHNVVNALLALKRFEEAEPIGRELLTTVSAHAEPTSLLHLYARQNVAVALTGLRRFDEAEPLYRDIIDRWTRRSGADHPSTLIQTNNYAMLLLDAGRHDDALTLLRRVGEALDRRPSATLEPVYRRNLGRTLLAAGQPKAAEVELETAYRLSVASGNAAASGDNARTLADALERQNRPDDAARWRLAAEKHDANRHPTTRSGVDHPTTTISRPL